MKRSLVLLLFLTLAAHSLSAQQRALTPGSPPLIKYGKWATRAASVTMNLLAVRAHDRAEQAFRVITQACVEDTARCATLPNGSYVDPLLEQKYQESLDHDRSARRWLIGGQTLLVGSAVAFIWELTRSKSRPGNIPFEPQVEERNGRTEIGLRFSF